MHKKNAPHLDLAHEYWKSIVTSDDLAIDATIGNGHDTLFLSGLAKEVIGLDIQPEALKATAQRTEGLNVRLHLLSHAEIRSIPLPHPPKLIVFNLGYLPGGDKSLTTRRDTTLHSAQESLTLLAPGGALSITCYPHEEGLKEEAALVQWTESLDVKSWHISHHKWEAGRPTLLWICALHS